MRWRTWSVAAVCLLAAGSVRADYVDFSTDPGFVANPNGVSPFAIAPGWTTYAFYGGNNGTVAYEAADQNIQLTMNPSEAWSGLYQDGATRGPTDAVAVTFSNLAGLTDVDDGTGDSWTAASLVIAAHQTPTLLGGATDEKAAVRNGRRPGHLGQLEYVLQGVNDAGGAFDFSTAFFSAPAGPVTLSIVRNGSGYLFEANGTTIFDSSLLGVSITAALPYYVMTWGDGVYNVNSVSIRADNFGVPPPITPEPGTLALLTAGVVGLACCAWRKRR